MTQMRVWLTEFDRLLRGGFTRPDDLQAGRIQIPVAHLVQGGLVLGASYGLFMGLYGALHDGNQSNWLYPVATACKVPLLFLMTLAVTFPSLYVFSALAGSCLRFRPTLRLLLAAIGVQLALLASLGPVVGFFTLSTQSYSFMILLNVLMFGASGLCGLVFLRRALDHVFEAARAEAVPAAPQRPAAPAEDPAEGTAEEPKTTPAARPLTRLARPDLGQRVFQVWLVVYGIVGAQMGWILRPFIGNPDQPFSLFRDRDGSFFGAVFEQFFNLFR